MRLKIFSTLINHAYSTVLLATRTARCGCNCYSTGVVGGEGDNTAHSTESPDPSRVPDLQSLLDDSALGSGPLDEDGTEDDEWRSSPYPPGSIIDAQKSQAFKSLRPKVDPSKTSIVLFPGEGSQFVGMGRDLLRFPKARDIFEASSAILKYDILKLMLDGPQSKLNEIRHSQVAVMVCSLAALERLKEERPTALETCMAAAGFGIGELTALTFAGTFTFSDGKRGAVLCLVPRRVQYV